MRPVTVVVISGILFILFIGFAYFEFIKSKTDILSIMKEEGFVLLNSLLATGERSVLAYEEIESQNQERLIQHATVIEALDYEGLLTKTVLDMMARKMNLYRVHVIDIHGVRVRSNQLDHSEKGSIWDTAENVRLLNPLLLGNKDTLLIGFRMDADSNDPQLGAALQRRKGGAVVVVMEATELYMLRQEFGPGRLVQEIAKQPGVTYVVLQDTLGIRLGSKGVTSMDRILQDPFLKDLYFEKTRNWRMIGYNEEKVLEIVGAFIIEGNHLGLFRIGLDMQYYRYINTNAFIRMILIVLVFVFIGMVGFSLFLANQNVRVLSRAYERIQTHTGVILQNLEDAVIAIDVNGYITEINKTAESLFELKRINVIGEQIQKLSLPGSDLIQKTLETKHPQLIHKENILIQHEKKVLSMRTSLVWGKTGNIDAIILVANDLTTEFRLEQQVRQQEKLSAMGILASSVAHEIRNPINAIGMVAQRLLKEFTPKRDEKEYCQLSQSISKEVRRINDIVQQFLQFARPKKLERRPVSMVEFFKELHSLFHSSIQGTGIDVSYVYNDEGLRVERTDNISGVTTQYLWDENNITGYPQVLLSARKEGTLPQSRIGARHTSSFSQLAFSSQSQDARVF